MIPSENLLLYDQLENIVSVGNSFKNWCLPVFYVSCYCFHQNFALPFLSLFIICNKEKIVLFQGWGEKKKVKEKEKSHFLYFFPCSSLMLLEPCFLQVAASFRAYGYGLLFQYLIKLPGAHCRYFYIISFQIVGLRINTYIHTYINKL